MRNSSIQTSFNLLSNICTQNILGKSQAAGIYARRVIRPNPKTFSSRISTPIVRIATSFTHGRLEWISGIKEHHGYDKSKAKWLDIKLLKNMISYRCLALPLFFFLSMYSYQHIDLLVLLHRVDKLDKHDIFLIRQFPMHCHHRLDPRCSFDHGCPPRCLRRISCMHACKEGEGEQNEGT